VARLQLAIECDKTWQQAHCRKGVNLVVKFMVSCCPYIYVGFCMIPANFCPGSERRMVNALVVLEGSANVAFVQIGASMTVHVWY